MAIIYTYPKLQNPQGNELIVVSDVNNKNATRLITVADIASLVPSGTGGGGGCATAINRINTSNGEYIATGCNPVEFSSPDNTISISAASNGIINFTAGCATTYVLKPVSCDNVGNCSPTTDSSTWLFSCESSFASTADQSVPVVISNGGAQIQTSFSSNNCFYVETWSPTPAPTSCENCCTAGEERGIYEQCNNNNGLAGCPSMAQQIILSPIQGAFPAVVLATYGDPNTGQVFTCCYSYSSAVQGAPETPNYTAQSLATGQNCDTAPCVNVSQSNEYQKCSECDETQPLTIYLADNFEAVSFRQNAEQDPACYIRIGKSTEPITDGLYTEIPDSQSCEQLNNSGFCPLPVAELNRCAELSPSGIAGNTATVYVDVNNPNLQAYPGTYRVSFSDGSFSCYVRAQQNTCKIPTVISTLALVEDGCGDDSCSDVTTNYQWRNCEDEEFQSTSSDLSIYAPAAGEYVFGSAVGGSWQCIVVAEGGDGTGAAKDLSGFVLQDDCNCCTNNYNIFTYEQCGSLSGCPGMNNQVNVQVPLGLGDDPANAPITIVVEDTNSGTTCCYTNPTAGSCLAATPGYAYVSTVAGGCNDETCTEDPLGTRFVYTPCDGIGANIVSDAAIHSAAATFIFYDCKWYEVPPQTQGNEPLSGVTSDEVINSELEECPELNQLRFERCDGQTPDIFVDCGSGCLSKGSWVLNGVYKYDNVCYTFTNVTSEQVAVECEEPFEFVEGGCESGDCAEETVKYLYEKCSGVDSDDCGNAFAQVVLEGTAAQLTPNLVIENTTNNAQCCYVRLEESEDPATANHSIVVSINNCEDETLIETGCKNAEETSKFVYIKCEGATGGTCEEMDPEVIIEAPVADLYDFAVISNGQGAQCCYTKNVESTSAPTAGHTIVSEFDNCDELPEVCTE